jgi:hypothetical protein
MSRSYRIRVRELLRRVIRATDEVRSQLELLEILPADQMAELLAGELLPRGFRRKGNEAVRTDDGVTVTVHLDTGEVSVRAEAAEQLKLSGEKEGRGWDDAGPNRKEVEARARKELQASMEEEAQAKGQQLQRQVTDRLERKLADLRQELDQAVNRATAAALRQKAAQLGQIREMTEDPTTGSLTIVVEV